MTHQRFLFFCSPHARITEFSWLDWVDLHKNQICPERNHAPQLCKWRSCVTFRRRDAVVLNVQTSVKSCLRCLESISPFWWVVMQRRPRLVLPSQVFQSQIWHFQVGCSDQLFTSVIWIREIRLKIENRRLPSPEIITIPIKMIKSSFQPLITKLHPRHPKSDIDRGVCVCVWKWKHCL